MSNSDDEDFQLPLIAPDGRVSRSIARCRRANYLDRVAEALMDLGNEEERDGKVCLPLDILVKLDMWKGSSFQFHSFELSEWKQLVDEHHRFNRQMTDAENTHELQYGEILLMEEPLNVPIEGENYLWGATVTSKQLRMLRTYATTYVQ